VAAFGDRTTIHSPSAGGEVLLHQSLLLLLPVSSPAALLVGDWKAAEILHKRGGDRGGIEFWSNEEESTTELLLLDPFPSSKTLVGDKGVDGFLENTTFEQVLRTPVRKGCCRS
jgi:hypothetical protein